MEGHTQCQSHFSYWHHFTRFSSVLVHMLGMIFMLQYRQSAFCIPSMTPLAHLGQIYSWGIKSPESRVICPSWRASHNLLSACIHVPFSMPTSIGPSHIQTAKCDQQLVICTNRLGLIFILHPASLHSFTRVMITGRKSWIGLINMWNRQCTERLFSR